MGVNRLYAPDITPVSARSQAQEKALIAQRFRDLEANPHASVRQEEAKLPLMAPLKR
jgi:hypothetical protein